jgi:hypothetical protein
MIEFLKSRWQQHCESIQTARAEMQWFSLAAKTTLAAFNRNVIPHLPFQIGRISLASFVCAFAND